MTRRAFVLHEMGFTPLWASRFAPQAAPASPPPPQPEPALPDAAAPAVTPAPFLQPTAEEPALLPATADIPMPGLHIAPQDWAGLQQAVAACQRCALAKTRHQVVVGRGTHRARLLIIGEAPGEQEDRQGLPFVGKAGQLLENMLAATGLDSERDVYICNVIKCRPPGNRNPAADEIAHCSDYLRWQIDNIQPQLIVALGRFAAHTLLQSQAAISSLRRQVHQAYGVPVLVTFHPAYLLRSPAEKAKAWQDWCQAGKLLSGTPQT